MSYLLDPENVIYYNNYDKVLKEREDMKNEVRECELRPTVEIKNLRDAIKSSRIESRGKVSSKLEHLFTEFLKSKQEIFVAEAINSLSCFAVYKFFISRDLIEDCVIAGIPVNFILECTADIFSDEADDEITIFINPIKIDTDDIYCDVCFTFDC